MANAMKAASAKLKAPQERTASESPSRPKAIYGPANPHPLSQMKTEVVWEGKYDEFGNRREIDVAGAAMPLQRIETVDDPRSRAVTEGDQPTLFSLEKERKKLGDFRNLLVWGENKLVMASLLKDFKGRVDLIYIDPPFDVGADFTMDVPIGDEEETVAKDQSTLELVAYRDMWGKGTNSYLQMMFERFTLMKGLLSDTGCIYVHCDSRVNAMLRMILDELFGKEHHVNDIIWHYKTFQGQTHSYFAKKHDTLFLYRKGERFAYHEQFDTEFEDTIDSKRWASYLNEKHQIVGRNMPTQDSRFVRYLKKWMKEHGREPNPDEVVFEVKGQPIDSVWDMKGLDPKSLEKVDYATQKPKALIERIIRTSSNEGDLVADFFCGSGTTGAVAEQLGRRWIMCDLGRFAIHTSRKRLIEVQQQLHDESKPYRAFDVYNLGRYERQWWQREHLKGADEEHRKVVMEFYHAEPLPDRPSPFLHGRKGPALVHVDSIDGVFTRVELKAVAEAAKAAGAKEIKCLAWDFEMDLRLHANALEADLGVKVALLRIPREIMEKNRTEVPFFEIGSLEAEPVIRRSGGKTTVDIKLKSFLPSLAEVPARELDALKERVVKHGFDFIDFWAVDFDYRDDQPFKHHWQDYRTRKDRNLKTVTDIGYEYPKPGTYTVCIKVIDTFGCDTSVLVEVRV